MDRPDAPIRIAVKAVGNKLEESPDKTTSAFGRTLQCAAEGAKKGARLGRFGGPSGAITGAVAGGLVGYLRGLGKESEKGAGDSILDIKGDLEKDGPVFRGTTGFW